MAVSWFLADDERGQEQEEKATPLAFVSMDQGLDLLGKDAH